MSTDTILKHDPGLKQTRIFVFGASILQSLLAFDLRVFGLIGAVIVAIPILAIFVVALGGSVEIWPHLLENVLPGAAMTTVLLMAGVALFTGGVGSTLAWLVSRYQFPGRRFLSWALVLPLALPTYLTAFSYVEILDAVGPVQSGLRTLLQITNARDLIFPEIRSLWGAILIMGCALYPYTYLAARAALLLQSRSFLDSARSLGAGPWRLFFRIGLPLIRPAIVVGVMLALMETLNDIGAIEILGVRTLTYAIFETWLNRGSLAGAAQLALILLIIIIALFWIERKARGSRGFAENPIPMPRAARIQLSSIRAWSVTALCATPFIVGFIIPFLFLIEPAIDQLIYEPLKPTLNAAMTSAILASSAALITIILGFLMSSGLRHSHNKTYANLINISAMGYAIPGTILAIGILIPFAALDNLIDDRMRAIFDVSTGLLITGSGFTLIYAHSVRFMAISHGTITSNFSKISMTLDYAARSLGRSSYGIMRDVHLPLLRPALLSAGLLVFVDSMKELSATLLLRPFNVETLSTLVYQAATREAFAEGALPALLIAVIGILPVVIINRTAFSEIELHPATKTRS